MIHEVKIKNIFSFREEQTLSFEASTDASYQDIFCVEVKPKMKLLKLGMIYGANASGKTNFLKALNFLRQEVLIAKENKQERIGFIPFLLDNHSRKENGSFNISFFINDTRFVYTLILNRSHIKKEKLIFYPKTQPALIFNREYDKEKEISIIDFGKKLKISNKAALVLEGNTIKNSTLLSIYNKSNVRLDLLEQVIGWFKNNLTETISPSSDLIKWTKKKLEASSTSKNFIVDVLQKADFNIDDILIEEQNGKQKKNGNPHPKTLAFLHSTNAGKFKIPLELQSSGTVRYLGLSGILSLLIYEKKSLFIDELETSLHYELINHFLKTFLVNATTSQLLFTTHNINILNLDFIRRDAVWFCEKNKQGATELFSAFDFGLHKNLSLFNAYKVGKLGAKPNPGTIFLERKTTNKKGTI